MYHTSFNPILHLYLLVYIDMPTATDSSVLLHIFSFIYNATTTQQITPLSLTPFSVCRRWHEVLTGSQCFWQQLFHTRFPRFFTPLSPSKKRSVNLASVDYRTVYLYTCAVLQIDSSFFNPVINKEELEDQFLEQHIPSDATRYRRELMEAVAFRLFSSRFPQFVSYTHHHLLYGPVGCGKTTLIESLARLWGSHLVTLQFPLLAKLESRLGWSGYVDYVCNYLLSFAKSNIPCIMHLHDLSNIGTPRMQLSITSLLDSIPLTNVWVIGTTTNPNLMNVSHAKYLGTKLFIPFPTASERETFLKSQLLYPFRSFPSSSPTSSLSSSPSGSLSSSPSCAAFDFPPPVASDSIHLLALHTHDFTYTDLKILCQKLRDRFLPIYSKQKESIPFVKLMDVLSKIVPMYKPDDAKKFEDFDPAVLTSLCLRECGMHKSKLRNTLD